MSADRMQLLPEDLASAAVTDAGTHAGAVAASIKTSLTARDTADVAAATQRTAALTESPPVLVEQDQQGAEDYTRAGAQFPTPVMAPSVPGKVWTT